MPHTEQQHPGVPAVEDQFEDYEKQAHAVRLGMWIFLGSETLLFAGLFALYTAYRAMYPTEIAQAIEHSNLTIGTINTILIDTSSFTVAWSIHAMRRSRYRTAALALAGTIVLGVVFLVLKGVEYAQHFHEGIYPGAYYSFEALPTRGARLYFTLYYFMTGLHALHLLAGVIVLLWLLVQVLRRRYTAARHTPLQAGSLYWHMIDVVWIFLWPLLYLAR